MRFTLDDGTEIEVTSGAKDEGRVRRVSDDTWTEAHTVEEALGILLGVPASSAVELLERAMVRQGAVQREHSLQFKPDHSADAL